MSRFTKNVIALVVLVVVIIGGIIVVINMRAANADTGSGETSQVSVPVKQATNVEKFKVEGGNDVLVFDIVRDGQTLTCTTKEGYSSGVGCVKK